MLMMVLCLSCGCASNPHDQARNFATGAVLADAVSTHERLHDDCVEENALYDGTTNKDQIVIVNVLIAGAIWWFAGELKKIDGPTWPLWVAGAFRAGVTVNNITQDCE